MLEYVRVPAVARKTVNSVIIGICNPVPYIRVLVHLRHVVSHRLLTRLLFSFSLYLSPRVRIYLEKKIHFFIALEAFMTSEAFNSENEMKRVCANGSGPSIHTTRFRST